MEIEECFRIMKHELKARPVYLSREDRISAHFTTCFLALIIYRYLELAVQKQFTCTELIETLRSLHLLGTFLVLVTYQTILGPLLLMNCIRHLVSEVIIKLLAKKDEKILQVSKSRKVRILI